MGPALAFFGIATLVACLFRGIGELRLRAAARRRDDADAELCGLERANRITSVTLLASLLGLALLGLAYVVA